MPDPPAVAEAPLAVVPTREGLHDQLLAEMSGRVPVGEIVEAVERALHAKKVEIRKKGVIEVEDHDTQLKAARFALENLVGKPLERREVVRRTEASREKMRLVMEKPSMKAAMLRTMFPAQAEQMLAVLDEEEEQK